MINIAHRISCHWRSDQILVMDRGRILEKGGRDALLHRNAFCTPNRGERLMLEEAPS